MKFMKIFSIYLFVLRSWSDDNNNSNNSNNHQTTYNLLCGPTTANSQFEQNHFDTLNQSTNFNVADTNNSLLTMPMHQNMHQHTHAPHYHAQHNGNHVYYNWQVGNIVFLYYYFILIWSMKWHRLIYSILVVTNYSKWFFHFEFYIFNACACAFANLLASFIVYDSKKNENKNRIWHFIINGQGCKKEYLMRTVFVCTFVLFVLHSFGRNLRYE